MARIYGSTNNSNWGLFVDLNETSYSVGNNNSNVRASVYLYRTSSASYYGGSATIGVTVNGEYKSTGFYPSYPTNIGAGEGNAHLVATFDYTVPHNDDGSKTVSMSMSWSANFSPSSGSASGSISLTNIPRQANITSATDFTDEENPTITYENKAGNSVSFLQACISLTGVTDDIEYRDIPKTGSSYTFELTDSERNVLRNATLSGSTQRQVIFYVKTGIGGNTYYSTLTKTLTIVNCSPTVTATIEDINTATLEITGSSSSNIVIVKGYSKAKITPTAAAKKGASITSIKVNDTVVSKESIELSGTDKYEVRAYDNRGLVASKDLVGGTDFTFINYIPLTFSGTLERHTPTGNQLDLSFSGNYFNGSFGTTDNSLTIKWYWKEKNAAEWTLGGTLVKDTDFVINNNVYHSGITEKETKISLGNIFDYKKTYEIKIEYSDALLKNNSITLLGRKGKPVYNWGRDFFNINGELRINNKNFLQIEYNESTDSVYNCDYINKLNHYPTVVFEATQWDDMKKGLDTVYEDVSSYKYLDIYYCSYGFTGGSVTGGNAINDIIRVDLTHPSLNPTLMYDSVDWRYGGSKWYPDAQFFIGSSDDPGFFIEAAFVSADKSKILIGKSGYYVISSSTIQMVYTGDNYLRVSKIVGYK